MITDRNYVIMKLKSLCSVCNARSDISIGDGKIAWAGYANALSDAIALLKEHKEQVTKWLMCITDNQLANSPNGNEDELDLMYKTGIIHGLQMAFEILTEKQESKGSDSDGHKTEHGADH